jgi:hypothetical protein
MTREEARQNLVALGIEEPSEAQVTNYLNQFHSNRPNPQPTPQPTPAPQPNPTPEPTPNPEPDDNTRALQERIEQLERENVQKDIRAYAAEKGLTGEQAESVLAGFQTDLEAAKKAIDSIAQIISDKETAAATAKEQELLQGTPNPGGGTGGDPDSDKPEDVKNAESISFGNKADEQSTKDYYVLK